MWHLADQDTSILINYKVDGDFIVPTSASYRVLSSDGSVIVSANLLATSSTELVTIPLAYNGLAGSNEYEDRFFEFTFFHDGKPHRKMIPYHLAAFIPLTATPADVRSAIGLDTQELPDNDVDMLKAYFSLRWQNGDSFKTALTSGGQQAAAANEAVMLKAALTICDSLEMRALIVVRAEDSQVQRSSKIDFSKIGNRISQRLATALDTATGTNVVIPNLFALSDPEDPFSG